MARPHGSWATAAVFVTLLVALCDASFDVELGGAAVVTPAAQGSRRRFDVALANFGKQRYGAMLMGQLVYPHSDAAHGWKADCPTTGCNYGCTAFNESRPPLILTKEPGKCYIMLLDRGPSESPGAQRPCYFLDKAWRAQQAGADALLVINDHGGDLSTAVAPKDEDSAREVGDLTISAGLISQEDGNALKQLLRDGPVTLALNWTDVLPKSHKVQWEFWTNSNDECGTTCEAQKNFIKNFKAAGKLLQVKGLVDFQPHYLIWVCQGSNNKEVCDSQCIRGGAYCCPDPDDNIHEGYSGADVLQMNLRSLCFARVARDRGEPWLWWEWVDKLGDECRMRDKLYTPECAQKVFDAVAGENVGGAEGRAAWLRCIGIGGPTSKGPILLLDEELQLQMGGDGQSTVAILPTIRISGKQYRGNLEAGSVLRALCAAFPAGSEPAVCVEAWVSEDECVEGGDGWRACNSGSNSSKGRTRCINTFKGFTCECGAGYLKVTNKITGEESCAEVNECLLSSVPFTRPDCSCERCACTKTEGGFNCSGPLPDYCSPELDYAGCWRGSFGGKLYHACSDNLKSYRYLAGYGRLNSSVKPFRCQCPPCFRATQDGKGCEPACDLSSSCSASLGACLPSGGVAASGSGMARGGGGISFLGAFLAMLSAAGATAAVMYGVYHLHVRRRMEEDLRSILEEYVPLSAAPQSDPNDPGDQASTPTSGFSALSVCRADSLGR